MIRHQLSAWLTCTILVVAKSRLFLCMMVTVIQTTRRRRVYAFPVPYLSSPATGFVTSAPATPRWKAPSGCINEILLFFFFFFFCFFLFSIIIIYYYYYYYLLLFFIIIIYHYYYYYYYYLLLSLFVIYYFSCWFIIVYYLLLLFHYYEKIKVLYNVLYWRCKKKSWSLWRLVFLVK